MKFLHSWSQEKRNIYGQPMAAFSFFGANFNTNSCAGEHRDKKEVARGWTEL